MIDLVTRGFIWFLFVSFAFVHLISLTVTWTPNLRDMLLCLHVRLDIVYSCHTSPSASGASKPMLPFTLGATQIELIHMGMKQKRTNGPEGCKCAKRCSAKTSEYGGKSDLNDERATCFVELS